MSVLSLSSLGSAGTRLPTPFAVGSRVLDRFSIVGVRDSTPRRIVYVARDHAAGADQPSGEQRPPDLCLLKHVVVPSTWGVTAALQQKQTLLREASLLALLTHPHIARVRLRRDDGHAYYLVQDFPGAETVDSIVQGGAHVPLETVLEWVLQLCDVLRYLHTLQPFPVVYRDVRPAQLSITTGQKLVLHDFLPAIRQLGQKEALEGGELPYQAPELRMGQASPASDIYAVGGILLFLMTKEAPPIAGFGGLGVWSPMQSRVGTALSLVEPLIRRAMAPRPEERFPSILALRHAVAQALEQVSSRTAVAPSVLPQAGPRPMLSRPTASMAPPAAPTPALHGAAATPAVVAGASEPPASPVADLELARRCGGQRPRYQDVLRAVGTLLAEMPAGPFRLREIDDGIELEQKPLDPATPGHHHVLSYEELRRRVRLARSTRAARDADARRQEETSVPSSPTHPIWPKGVQDGMRTLGAHLDLSRCRQLQLLALTAEGRLVLQFVRDESAGAAAADGPVHRLQLIGADVAALTEWSLGRRSQPGLIVLDMAPLLELEAGPSTDKHP